jgi:hypothetical protein
MVRKSSLVLTAARQGAGHPQEGQVQELVQKRVLERGGLAVRLVFVAPA